MSEAIEQAAAQAKGFIKKIRAAKGKLQGNFYYAGNGTGTEAGLVVTLLSKDRKGQKALTLGKTIRKEISGAKFARGTVTVENNKLTFTLHTGSASSSLLKKGFKKTLADFDGLKVLRAAVIRKKGGDGEEDTEESVEENVSEDELDDAPPLTPEQQAREAAELKALIDEQGALAKAQGGIAALNAQLSATFLSQEEARAEQAEQLVDQIAHVKALASARPPDRAALREAQIGLARLTAVSDSNFPARAGQPVPDDLAQVLELSLDLLDETSPSSDGALQQRYRDLRAQIEAQLDIFVALFGDKDKDYKAHRQAIAQAHRAVLSKSPPDYNSGIHRLNEVLSAVVAHVSEGQRRYAAQRRREAELEQQRLTALKDRLRAESELRLLLSEIGKVEASIGADRAYVPAVTKPLDAALGAHGGATNMLGAKVMGALDKPTRGANQASKLIERAALQQANIDGQIKLGSEKLYAAQQALAAMKSAAAEDEETGPLLREHDALLKRIDGETRLTSEALDGLRGPLKLVYTRLILAAQSHPKRAALLATSRSQLEEISGDLARLIREYDEGYGGASEDIQEAERVLGAVTALVRPDDTLPYFARLEKARDYLELGEFVDAAAEAEEVREELEPILPALRKHKADWDGLDIAKIEARIGDQRDTGLAFPEAPLGLNFALQQVVAGVMQRSMSYEAGVQEVQDVVKKLDANAREMLDMAALRKDHDAALAAAEGALKALGAAAADQIPRVIKALLGPYEDRLKALRAEGAAATSAAKLSLNLTALKALAAEAKQAAGEGLGEALDGAELAAARKELEIRREHAHELLKRLRELGRDELGTAGPKIDTYVDGVLALEDASKILYHSRSFLKTTIHQLRKEVAAAQTRARKLKAAVKEAYGRAQEALKTFSAAVEEDQSSWFVWMRSDSKEEYVRYVGTLKEELRQLRAMAAGEYPNLIQQCVTELDRFTADTEAALRGLRDLSRSGAPGKDSHTALAADIEEKQLSRLRDDADVSARLPAKQKQLVEKLTTLKGELGAELLVKSMKRYRDLSQEVDALLAEGKAAAKALVDFNKKASQIELMLRAKDQPINAFETLQADLKRRLESARALSKQEGSVANATGMLEAIEAKFRAAQEGPELAKMVRVHDRQEREQAQARAEWEAALAAFNRELFDPFEAAVNGDKSLWERFAGLFVDDRRIGEVRELRAMATDSADKGDYQMARYQLSMARSRMEFHMAYPEGQDAAMIADLKRLPSLWRGAVASYGAAVQATTEAVAVELVKAGAEDEAQAVVDAAAPLLSLLQSDAFDPAIAALTADGADADARRAAREAGLAAVRAQRERLSDPRLRFLAKHPFSGVPAFSGHFQAGKVLTDAEKSILLTSSDPQ